MKRLLAMAMALVMSLALVACGSDDSSSADVSDVSTSTSQPAEDGSTSSDSSVPEGRISDEQLAELTTAYNNVAVPYNEIATQVNENGWMADEQTKAEMEALSNTLGFIGAGLTEDISLLDGSDFDALISYLEDEFPPALEELQARVSVPYEG